MSTETKTKTKWIELSCIPFSYHIFAINSDEFAVIEDSYGSMKLYKYNVKSNSIVHIEVLAEISELINIDEDTTTGDLAFDAFKHDLYFVANGNLHSWNIKTKEMKELKPKQDCFDVDEKYILFVDDHIHRIHWGNHHWIGHVSVQSQLIKPVERRITSLSENRHGRLIHIPSKHCILLIGGYDDHNKAQPDLWIFSLSAYKWKKIQNIKYLTYAFGAVLTSNERYIVLLGGMNIGCVRYDDIYVLDMKNEDENKWKMKKSSIKCPQIGVCNAVRTGGVDSKDDILVDGFIKDCFQQKDFENIQLPPAYIIKMIADWYTAEMVHWIHWQHSSLDSLKSFGSEGNHQGIYLKDILSSL